MQEMYFPCRKDNDSNVFNTRQNWDVVAPSQSILELKLLVLLLLDLSAVEPKKYIYGYFINNRDLTDANRLFHAPRAFLLVTNLYPSPILYQNLICNLSITVLSHLVTTYFLFCSVCSTYHHQTSYTTNS